jgi:hypothetical protein
VVLADAGYITRQRDGRGNRHTTNAHLPLPDPIARDQNIGEPLKILNATSRLPARAADGASANTCATSTIGRRWPRRIVDARLVFASLYGIGATWGSC